MCWQSKQSVRTWFWKISYFTDPTLKQTDVIRSTEKSVMARKKKTDNTADIDACKEQKVAASPSIGKSLNWIPLLYLIFTH